jgi:hypothetical protein
MALSVAVLALVAAVLHTATAVTVTVPSAPLWVHTGIAVQANATYAIAAPGEQTWTDWFIVSNASGYVDPFTEPFTSLLRYPAANFFTLIACVGTPANISTGCSPVGISAPAWEPQGDGELVMFANDVSFMYWNNYGELNVTVERVGSSDA